MGKGLRDRADGLDEQETQQYRSLVGTALYVGQDKSETPHATKEAPTFMSDPTRAAKCMLKRLCKYCSEAPVLSLSFPYQEIAVVRRRRGRSSSQAWRAQRGRHANKDGRSEANDLAFESNTPSATNGLELMDGGDNSPRGCRCSKRLPCIDLEREEHVRDE